MANTNANNFETIRNQKIDTLNELIEITRDSANFYKEAATSVPNPQLKTLFTSMADSRSGLVGALSKEVRAEGAKPAQDGTVRGSWDRWYGDIRARMGKDKDFGYVSQLESSEDRLLDAYNNVVSDQQVAAPVKQTVSQYLPRIRAQHDEMRDRKWEMQARA